jgi:hypothetical protein
VVALADREHEVAIFHRVEGGVPLPQAVLPVPVLGEKQPAGVLGVGVGDVELRRRPVRDADLPQGVGPDLGGSNTWSPRLMVAFLAGAAMVRGGACM